MAKTKAFTLIELSIVLVIIGLVVGGILAGRDLISTAGIRATIAQVDKFNQAVNTFRGKYGYLPGDIPRATAGQFGLYRLNDPADTDCPNNLFGNDLIQSGPYDEGCYFEVTVFWRHLTDTRLIEGAYGVNPGNPLTLSGGGVTHNVSGSNAGASFFPAAKMRDSLYFVPKNWDLANTSSYFVNNYDAPNNYYALVGVSGVNTDDAIDVGNVLTPAEAYRIDEKMDDGKPNTGSVRSYAAFAPGGGWNATADPNSCMTGGSSGTDTADIYNKDPATGGNKFICPLFIKIQ